MSDNDPPICCTRFCTLERNTAYIRRSRLSIKCRRLSKAYIQAIRNYLGNEPDGAELETRVFDGDKGMFYEVVCYYDPEQPASHDYAIRCERQAPHTWQEGGVSPPPTVGGVRSR